MEESNLTDGLLRAEIDRIMLDIQLYKKMAEGARSFGRVGVAEQMTTLLLEVAKEH
jgi:UDP-N-acetylglucosamine:LPS N-acetylglucosamine transferase